VNLTFLKTICERLKKALPTITCQLSPSRISIPKDAYNPARKQYYSTFILNEIYDKTRHMDTDGVLGVTEVDLYAPHLNFVFGEAQCPGKAAVISLHRLKPEFYGLSSDHKLFEERGVKEAAHELGHVFGLNHCRNPVCVMFFSNSIHDTDFKQAKFCNNCSQKLRL